MNALRKPLAQPTQPQIDVRRQLELLENMQTLMGLMHSLLAETFNPPAGDFRSEMASTLYTLRCFKKDGLIDQDMHDQVQLAIEDCLTPSDDLGEVSREAMAAVFELLHTMQRDAIDAIREAVLLAPAPVSAAPSVAASVLPRIAELMREAVPVPASVPAVPRKPAAPATKAVVVGLFDKGEPSDQDGK